MIYMYVQCYVLYNVFSWKFSPGKDVYLFHPLLTWVKFYPVNFFNDYIELMVTFAARAKFISWNISEMQTSPKLPYTYLTADYLSKKKKNDL